MPTPSRTPGIALATLLALALGLSSLHGCGTNQSGAPSNLIPLPNATPAGVDNGRRPLPPKQLPRSATDNDDNSRLMTTDEQLAALNRALAATAAVPRLGPSDILSISVYDEPDLSINGMPVRPDGMISFPLIGDVQAEGLTVNELKESVSDLLRQFVLDPKVSVIVQTFNSLTYTINGEVVRPGVYPLTGNVKLTDAIAKAGGLNKGQFRATSVELADLTHAFISRDGTLLPVDFIRLLRHGDLRFDIELAAADFISIPSGLSQEVYIVGEVNAPALFAFRENMPMSRTLAQAEGFTRDADLTRIHVVRGALSNPTLIVMNFKDVIKGKAQDVRLEPGDIVYVPPTHLSNWARMVNQIVPTMSALQTAIILGNTVSGSSSQ